MTVMRLPKRRGALGHFETDIAAADYDEVGWQIVEFESLYVCERPGGPEAGNAWGLPRLPTSDREVALIVI